MVRALLALVLMVGFYALALGLIVALVLFVYVQLTRSPIIWTAGCVIALVAVAIIVDAILPRRERFTAPGPRLDPARHAALAQEIQSIAAATDQRVPDEIYLTGELGAWVRHCGGIAGLGGRRVMGLGIPLLDLLSVAELRAVIAHEFGHFHAGDSRIGALIYVTRSTLERTEEALAESRSPGAFLFRCYAALFSRVSLAVSRRQEYAADRLAAHVAGGGPMASALQKIHRTAPFFQAFMDEEVAPVVERQFRPPIVDGFRIYLRSRSVAAAADRQLERELTCPESETMRSHPSLPDRLRALEDLPRGGDVQRRAFELINDAPTLERELAPFLFGPSIAHCPVLVWEEALARVYRPEWQRQAKELLPSFADTTAGQLAAYSLQFRRLGQQIRAKGTALEQTARAKSAVAVGLAFALERAGWQLERNLGEPLTLRRDGLTFQPFAAIQRLASGDDKPDTWRAEMARLGISELRLGDALSS